MPKADDFELASLKIAIALREAVGLLEDYVRIYPKNSGRTKRFLERLEVELADTLKELENVS